MSLDAAHYYLPGGAVVWAMVDAPAGNNPANVVMRLRVSLLGSRVKVIAVKQDLGVQRRVARAAVGELDEHSPLVTRFKTPRREESLSAPAGQAPKSRPGICGSHGKKSVCFSAI